MPHGADAMDHPTAPSSLAAALDTSGGAGGTSPRSHALRSAGGERPAQRPSHPHCFARAQMVPDAA